MNLIGYLMGTIPREGYNFKTGQIVYYYDVKYNKIRKMKINHTMSGNSDNWEYYHCTCIDPKEIWKDEYNEATGINIFGKSVCEISQKELFSTTQEAQEVQEAQKLLKR